MSMMEKTRRECPRVKLTGQARILRGTEFDGKGDLGQICGGEFAQIVDASMNGISLILNSDLEVNQEYMVRMSIYPNIEFDFSGQVVWMTNTNGMKMYGMQFKSIGMDNKLRLQQVIINNLMDSTV